MVVLKPFSDELYGSHFGRIWRHSGIADFKQFLAYFKRSVDVTPFRRGDSYVIAMLAKGSGMTFSEYVFLHTMTPFERAMVKPIFRYAHDFDGKRINFMDGLRKATCRGVFFCSDCIDSDLKNHGMSYWRRAHHMYGTASCLIHQRPLNRERGLNESLSSEELIAMLRNAMANVEKPVSSVERLRMFDPPSKFLTSAHLVDAEQSRDELECTNVQRFLYLSNAVLSTGGWIQSPHMIGEIQKRWQERGFRTSKDQRGQPLLSDSVQRHFPKKWLVSLHPSLSRKYPGNWLRGIDSTRPTDIRIVLLQCCVLFDTMEDARRLIEVWVTSKQP